MYGGYVNLPQNHQDDLASLDGSVLDLFDAGGAYRCYLANAVAGYIGVSEVLKHRERGAIHWGVDDGWGMEKEECHMFIHWGNAPEVDGFAGELLNNNLLPHK